MTQGSEQLGNTIDHLFRHHAGQMVSVLTRIFGVRHLELIEDAVQDAMVAAMRKWPHSEVPRNPLAWLTETAKNRVLDRLRRDARSESIDESELNFPAAVSGNVNVLFDSEMGEDQLKMIFACCHPSIAADSQVALTLKIVGGFSVQEIARAYLAKEESVAKMLTRAKQKLRSGGVPLEIPAGEELRDRLDAVLKVLYLMFNEGYGASAGEDLIRHDLCYEAIRLTEFLTRHPATSTPKTHAAAALFLFQAARVPARTDARGELILLADQDRSLWDKELIARGMGHMKLSANGDEISTFHLQAEIAAVYSLAPDLVSIDWERILECYSLLQNISFSPVAELNRAIVIGKLHGTAKALESLDRASAQYDLGDYNLLHLARGHFFAELGRTAEASGSYRRAAELTANASVKRFLENKILELQEN